MSSRKVKPRWLTQRWNYALSFRRCWVRISVQTSAPLAGFTYLPSLAQGKCPDVTSITNPSGSFRIHPSSYSSVYATHILTDSMDLNLLVKPTVAQLATKFFFLSRTNPYPEYSALPPTIGPCSTKQSLPLRYQYAARPAHLTLLVTYGQGHNSWSSPLCSVSPSLLLRSY
jgi:hypothetical protein